jgi:myo-inositol 2-dehydrogenase / D-chiro-inositol 1-dehydrogenase
VTEVYAVGGSLVDPDIGKAGDIDTGIITLTYASGAYCVIDNSRQAVYGYDQRIEVFGSEGCIVVGNRQPHEGTLFRRDGVQNPLPLYFFLERYQESFVEEARQFVQALKTGTPPLVSGIDGKIPVIMGLAAQQSLKEHRPVPIAAQPV